MYQLTEQAARLFEFLKVPFEFDTFLSGNPVEIGMHRESVQELLDVLTKNWLLKQTLTHSSLLPIQKYSQAGGVSVAC